MTLQIQIVDPSEHMAQARELIAANWAETGFDFPFAPNEQAYAHLAQAGLLFAVAAFKQEEIIGYCTVMVSPHMHNPEVIVAANDALFVAPEYRKGTVTARIIRAAENEAARRGAGRFLWHCRAGTNFAQVLTRHGYEPVDNVVMRTI